MSEQTFILGGTKFGSVRMLQRITGLSKRRCRLMLRDLRVPVFQTADRTFFLIDAIQEAFRLLLTLDRPGYAAPGSLPRLKGKTRLGKMLTSLPDSLLTPQHRAAARRDMAVSRKTHRDAAEAVQNTQLNAEKLTNIPKDFDD